MNSTDQKQKQRKIQPNVVRWLSGFGLGMLGDQIFYLALSWTAAQVFSPGWAGTVVAIGALPRALLMLIGGAVTDRAGARRIAVRSDAARLVTMVVFAVIAVATPDSFARVALLALALVFGAIDAFFFPSVGALPPRLVEAHALPRLQSLRSFVQRIATIAGPPLGGVVLASQGLAAALALNAALFAASLVALILTREISPSLPVEHRDEGSLFADIRDGVGYTISDPGLRGMLLLITLGEFAYSGPFTIGLTILGTDRGWSVSDVGAILSAFGAGAATTALLVATRKRVRNAGLVSLVAVLAMGLATGGIGLAPSLGGVILLAAAAGAASGLCSTLLITLFLVRSDPNHTGRVMSALSLATVSAAPASYLASGLIAEVWSPSMVFTAFGVVMALTAVAMFIPRSVRDQRLGEDRSREQ